MHLTLQEPGGYCQGGEICRRHPTIHTGRIPDSRVFDIDMEKMGIDVLTLPDTKPDNLQGTGGYMCMEGISYVLMAGEAGPTAIRRYHPTDMPEALAWKQARLTGMELQGFMLPWSL